MSKKYSKGYVCDDAQLLAEWHPTKNQDLSPNTTALYSSKKVWWLCEKGHEWHAAVSQRSRNRSKCPLCAGRKVIPGETDLETKNPKLASEWHPTRNDGLTPRDVFPNTTKKVWWLCSKCGHEWEATVNSRNHGCGCSVCGKAEGPSKRYATLLAERGSLATRFPQLAKEWHPTRNSDLLPLNVTPFSAKKAWWLCSKCGHEWETIIFQRSQGRGCPRCARLRK